MERRTVPLGTPQDYPEMVTILGTDIDETLTERGVEGLRYLAKLSGGEELEARMNTITDEVVKHGGYEEGLRRRLAILLAEHAFSPGSMLSTRALYSEQLGRSPVRRYLSRAQEISSIALGMSGGMREFLGKPFIHALQDHPDLRGTIRSLSLADCEARFRDVSFPALVRPKLARRGLAGNPLFLDHGKASVLEQAVLGFEGIDSLLDQRSRLHVICVGDSIRFDMQAAFLGAKFISNSLRAQVHLTRIWIHPDAPLDADDQMVMKTPETAEYAAFDLEQAVDILRRREVVAHVVQPEG